MVVSASTSGVTSVNRMMETVMMEPVFKSDEEILVARSIFQTQNNKMNALVQNHSNKPISLFQNTIMGNSFDECNVLNSCIKTKREEAVIDEKSVKLRQINPQLKPEQKERIKRLID
jgi:hypothetical protein